MMRNQTSFQVSAFSPGTLLWRAAKTAGTSPALTGEGQTVSFAELAAKMLEASNWRGSQPVSIGGSSISAIVAACQAFAAGKAIEGIGASTLQRGLSVEEHQIVSSSNIESVPFDSLAMYRKQTDVQGIGWSSEALSFAWGISASLEGSVSLIASEVCSVASWSSLFGVLLGRGTVLAPGEFASPQWYGALAQDKATCLDLSFEQASQLCEEFQGRAPSVRRLRVWSDKVTPPQLFTKLKGVFPHASLTRVIHWIGGPVGIASDDELSKHGNHILGRAPLGSRRVLAQNGEVLMVETPWQPQSISAASGWSLLGAVARNTGIRATFNQTERVLYVQDQA